MDMSDLILIGWIYRIYQIPNSPCVYQNEPCIYWLPKRSHSLREWQETDWRLVCRLKLVFEGKQKSGLRGDTTKT